METLSALAKMSGLQRVAPHFAQRLRIVEPLGKVVGIEDDRGDADGTCERAAAHLVDAGDPAAAFSHRLALEVEMGLGHRAGPSGPGARRARSKAWTSRSSAMKRSTP